MVHTWLTIFWWENRMPFTVRNLTSGFQMIELPSNKWIIIWVSICRDERSTPIHLGNDTQPIICRIQCTTLMNINRKLTCRPISFKSCMANGGKYSSQWAGSANSLISSSFKPKLSIICHWYLADPVLATALLYQNVKKNNFILPNVNGNNEEIIFVYGMALPFFPCFYLSAPHPLFLQLLAQRQSEISVDNHRFPFHAIVYRHMP